MARSVEEGISGILSAKARLIRLLLSDCDGVLTDGGVYYSARGEELKRFSIHDGMGVERLRVLAGIEVGIVTGEALSLPLQQRAKKLGIGELHMNAKDKGAVLDEILARRALQPEQVAYIGDDVNDLPAMQRVGLCACPADAMTEVHAIADYVCQRRGGHGAFREFAELIIAARS